MRLLRTLSTRRLLVLIAAIALVVVAGASIAVAASGDSGPTPPPKPLPDALHDAATAQAPDGITARVKFTNKLFPTGALLGNVGSALMSGASGRLWLSQDGGRIELQSNAGDVQVTWNGERVNVYDASSNTVYRATLPAQATDKPDKQGPPSLAEIQSFLTQLSEHASVSGAQPSDVAGRPAYTVRLAPKHDGGLLGAAEVAWDSLRGVPLRLAVYAQGASSPVLELKVTEISYGTVSSSDVNVAPPADAKVVDLSSSGSGARQGSSGPEVTGVDAVAAAVDFKLAAPDSLVGLPRRDVRLVGDSESKAALVLYGQGLGGIVVVERKADATAPKDVLSSLPTVALDGLTGHELATQLGTVITWQRDGVSYVLAGSLPSAAAEAAARALR